MKSILPLAALALLAAGCVNIGEKRDVPAVVYYVLDDAASGAKAAAAGPAVQQDRVLTLLVLDTATSGFYDTDQLVFSRSAGTRGHYQFARWTARPGKRLGELMRARLDREGGWRVAASGAYVRADVLLDTTLVEFYHDAAGNPGHIRLVLRAELVDLKQRTLLGRRVFEHEVPLETYDAAGAAAASNLAVGRALDDLGAWLASLQ